MNSPVDGSKEQAFDDLRQLMARQARKRDADARGPIGILRACMGIANGSIAQLLESRAIIFLAVSLIVVFIALLIQGPNRTSPFSADLIPPSGFEQAPAYGGTVDTANDGKDLAQDRSAENSRSSSAVDAPTQKTNESFIIRVGTFRDPVNAERVAEQLRKQTSKAVRTEVLPSGFHVVTLGPFSQRVAAQEIARSVQDAIGLAPEVFRREFE
jgi:sporulation related protein